MAFTCPRCGMTSHNPDDEANGYCGNCHDFTGVEQKPAGEPESGYLDSTDVFCPFTTDTRCTAGCRTNSGPLCGEVSSGVLG